MSTLDYYSRNAEEYVRSTLSADMSEAYAVFEKHLRAGARVLDLGCGSGRDSRHFIEAGYDVTAVDGSEEICRLASEITGIEVRCIDFAGLDYVDEFDGIWANASLLHVRKKELPEILKKISAALKDGGVLYASFKYGSGEREERGRHYSDFDEKGILDVLAGAGFAPIEVWKSEDSLERGNDWINLIAENS